MIKRTLTSLMLGSAVIGGMTMPAHAIEPVPMEAQGEPTTKVSVYLKGYVFGFRVLTADYRTNLTPTRYSASADLKTSGLGAMLQKFRIWATTTGRFNGSDLVPIAHIQQNQDKKNRRVEMNYGANAVDVKIVPPLGTQGVPAASPKQRFESDDALSGLLNLMMRGYRTSEEPCSGKVAMFDSKQHYYLRMEKAGTKYIKQKGYRGDTIKCHIYYEAVSGYDPEDLPSAEEAGTPIKIYLGNFPEAGLYIPVRMSYKVSGFKAVIKARDIKITTE
jgi:hypothetical protein